MTDDTALSKVILDSVIDAVITIDHSGIIRDANRATITQFGYALDELIGSDVTMLMPEKYVSAHTEALRRYRESGEGRIFGKAVELEARHRDGRVFPIELTLGRFREDGVELLTGVLRDISERKSAERELARQARELARSNEDLNQFAYVVSHDLKAPLRAISNYASFLHEDLA